MADYDLYIPPKPERAKYRWDYSDDWGDAICAQIVEGKSLREICLHEDAPSVSTIFKWLGESKSFAEKYARAREAQQDTYADEITYIADTEPDHNKARVRIDARKWHASKLAPKKYGDKLGLTDGDGGPLQVVIKRYGAEDDGKD